MEEKKYSFQKLTSVSDANISVYEEAVDFIFSNPDVKNVAISGSYGSGKSSMLESYKEKHKNKRYIHISLANFETAREEPELAPVSDNNEGFANEEDGKNGNDGKTDKGKEDVVVKESILEGKILNQLIHQIHPKRIPQTNFRVKHRLSITRITLISMFVTAISIAAIHLIFFNDWSTYICSLSQSWYTSILSWSAKSESRLISGFLCALAISASIYTFIAMQINKGIIKRFGTDKMEIEIFKDNDDSFFDKYLNEVLYLFDRSKADVIVFEDIDRFNNNRIFQRLREVNTLINVQRRERAEAKLSRKITRILKWLISLLKKVFALKPIQAIWNKAVTISKNNSDKPKILKNDKSNKTYKVLRFFYLIRDDLFISKDRTKFFDYIIPIVPIMDSSNSYEQFLMHLKEDNLLDGFDLSFLQSLSLYVDDMRLLKNIFQEFIVYIERHKIMADTKLNWNKMLALIAYKNLFPRDYHETQLRRGFVSELFAQKQQLIDAEVISKRERKQAILDRIEQVKNETLIRQEELDDAFAKKHERLPRDRYRNLISDGQALKEQYDEELPKRKQAVQDILDGNLPTLEAELGDIEHAIVRVEVQPLQELLTRENTDKVFAGIKRYNAIKKETDFNDIKSSNYFPLLKFLVFRGYIDETYPDYMTYFYEGSISANDKSFLRRITDRQGPDYTYQLREPQKVVESPVLRTVDFEQAESLNFDLLECLLRNASEPNYALYLKTLISQISETRNFDFVFKFYDTGKAHKQLIVKINEQWPDFFSLALKGKTISFNQTRQYSIDTLYFSDQEVIKAVNIDNCLTEYISKSPDFLAIDQTDIEELIFGFKLILVSFESIDYDKSNKVLFDEVYQQNLYDLTFENIALMLRKEYGIESDSDIAHKNYTLVQSCANSPLAEYVSKNMSAYTETVLASCNGSISDDENIAVNLLNSDAEVPAKKRYIEVLSTVIANITQVKESTLWIPMINHGIVAFTVNNFINYFQEHGIDASLVKYINDDQSEVDFTATFDNFANEVAESLYDAVAVCNGIAIAKYRKILIDLGYYFHNYEADDIIDEKILVLIEDGILHMDADGLEFIRNKYSKYLLTFIKRNLDEYFSLQTDEVFRLDEALQIIVLDIDDDKKIKLLAFANEPISAVGKRYTDAVSAYITTHNLKQEDKPYLYANYSQYGEQTQDAIVTLVMAAAGVREIIANKMNIDDALLSVLLQADSIAHDQKIELFTMSLPSLNEETCQSHFDELGLPDLKGIFSKSSGRRNYEKSSDVTVILDALKLYSWIYEYHDDERNNNRYVIVKNKPRKEQEILD